MTHTKQFAEDAKNGGYPAHKIPETIDRELYADEKMLLDAEAWKAVGKTRNWSDPHGLFIIFMEKLWWDDNSIEEALSVIT